MLIAKFEGCPKGVVSKGQIRWGGHSDPTGVLEFGKTYEVENVEVHPWHTKVFLKGIDGYFNSIWFEINEKV
jgi:hypothetical protein